MEQTTNPTTQQFVIRIADNSLSFALREEGSQDIRYEIYDTRKGISIAANLREAFDKSPLLGMAGRKITVIVDSPVMLTPIDEYEPGNAKEQNNYIFPGHEKQLLAACVLPSFKNTAVFAIDKDLGTVLSDHFEKVRIEPLMARVWEYLLQRNSGSNNKKVYAYFHENKMEVCSFTHNRFTFANSFDAKDRHDALYFLLGVWKQIGCNGMNDDLFLAGRITEREALTDDARQFLRRVYYINPVADFNRAAFTQVVNMPLDMMLQFK